MSCVVRYIVNRYKCSDILVIMLFLLIFRACITCPHKQSLMDINEMRMHRMRCEAARTEGAGGGGCASTTYEVPKM